MGYKDIQNISVDSVVLPNKPLSKLEIIDAAKSYHCINLYGYFWETLSQKKSKLYECDILNFDSSSGDVTHWVMWFRKVKDKFCFDSYGVQPPSQVIAYLKSPIFDIRERVQ